MLSIYIIKGTTIVKFYIHAENIVFLRFCC